MRRVAPCVQRRVVVAFAIRKVLAILPFVGGPFVDPSLLRHNNDSRRDFLAANPWIECMIAPFYFRIFTHYKSPKIRALLCPKNRSRSYPLQLSFPALALRAAT